MKKFAFIIFYASLAACVGAKKDRAGVGQNEPVQVEKLDSPGQNDERLLPQSKSADNFYKWLTKNSEKIPKENERNILMAYVKFLSSTRASDGETVVSLLKNEVRNSKKRLSVEWLSFFEGNRDLINSGESVGSFSLARLYPLVKKGHQTAINIVLMYSASVNSDGADGEGLMDYQKEVRKHELAIDNFKKSHADFLTKHRIEWLVN